MTRTPDGGEWRGPLEDVVVSAAAPLARDLARPRLGSADVDRDDDGTQSASYRHEPLDGVLRGRRSLDTDGDPFDPVVAAAGDHGERDLDVVRSVLCEAADVEHTRSAALTGASEDEQIGRSDDPLEHGARVALVHLGLDAALAERAGHPRLIQLRPSCCHQVPVVAGSDLRVGGDQSVDCDDLRTGGIRDVRRPEQGFPAGDRGIHADDESSVTSCVHALSVAASWTGVQGHSDPPALSGSCRKHGTAFGGSAGSLW